MKGKGPKIYYILGLVLLLGIIGGLSLFGSDIDDTLDTLKSKSRLEKKSDGHSGKKEKEAAGTGQRATQHATTKKLLSFDQLATQSTVIATGKVTTIRSYQDKQLIFTLVTVAVDDKIKGSPGHRLTVKKLGGKVGNLALKIVGSPEYREGEKVLLFLKPRDVEESTGKPKNYALVDFQGKFTVNSDPNTGRESVRQDTTGTKGPYVDQITKKLGRDSDSK